MYVMFKKRGEESNELKVSILPQAGTCRRLCRRHMRTRLYLRYSGKKPTRAPEHCGQVTSGWVVVQLSAMETLCCLGKIFYYVGLILYMVCDSLFDWLNLFRLYADKEEFKVDKLLFLFLLLLFLFMISCFVGLIINIYLLRVYWHYIKVHWDCFLDGYCVCPYKDHLCLNRLELWLSVVELVFKDDFQSVIVYLIYASHLTGSRPGWYFIVFSGCSIFAHFKRCVCFITKLCGCGKGEDEGSCIKCIVCLIGLLASAVFLLFTIMSLPICDDGQSCVLYIKNSTSGETKTLYD